MHILLTTYISITNKSFYLDKYILCIMKTTLTKFTPAYQALLGNLFEL